MLSIARRRACASLAALAMFTATTAPALPHEVGDWVLAPWRDSEQTFPGVVVGKAGSALTIRFDDGTRETRAADEVRDFDWRKNSRIECQWKDGNWYAATIRWLAEDGLTMQVRYDDDGVVERTTTGKCRSPH